ncbi:MAG: hypothetical protein HZB76_04380 [Chlamydiae bacterium]|nr:hypothetical protein [Chlamydiota bacterium]
MVLATGAAGAIGTVGGGIYSYKAAVIDTRSKDLDAKVFKRSFALLSGSVEGGVILGIAVLFWPITVPITALALLEK